MTRAAELLLVALILGCNCRPQTQPGWTPPPPPPGQCQQDSDCPPGQPRCIDGAILPSPDGGTGLYCGCFQWSDCRPNPCVRNQCVTCTTNADCQLPGLVCRSGRCGGCQSDADCAPPAVCHFGICGSACTSFASCQTLLQEVALWGQPWGIADAGPGAGLVFVLTGGSAFGCQLFAPTPTLFCSEAKPQILTCEPCGAPVLAIGSDAGSCGCPLGCVAGDCQCLSNADCPRGLACVSGFCQVCLDDSQCGCGQVCTLGRCTPPCTTDRECVDLRVGYLGCSAGGHCRYCLSDADCATDGGLARCYEDGCIVPCQYQTCGAFQGQCGNDGQCDSCANFPPGPPPEGPFPACDGGAPDSGAFPCSQDAGIADGG